MTCKTDFERLDNNGGIGRLEENAGDAKLVQPDGVEHGVASRAHDIDRDFLAGRVQAFGQGGTVIREIRQQIGQDGMRMDTQCGAFALMRIAGLTDGVTAGFQREAQGFARLRVGIDKQDGLAAIAEADRHGLARITDRSSDTARRAVSIESAARKFVWPPGVNVSTNSNL